MSCDASTRRDTPFIPQPDDEVALWEIEAITAETANKYKVTWAGTDPDTGKPWEPSWVDKSDCTDEAVIEWEQTKSKELKPGNQQDAVISNKQGQPGRVAKRMRQSDDDCERPSQNTETRPSKKRALQTRPHTRGPASVAAADPPVKIGPPRNAKRGELSLSRMTSNPSQPLAEKEGQPLPRISVRSLAAPVDPLIKVGPPRATKRKEPLSTSSAVTSTLSAPPRITSLPSKDTMDKGSEKEGLARALPTSAGINVDVTEGARAGSTAVNVPSSHISKTWLLTRVEEIKQLQCKISMASNAALKLSMEVTEALERD